MNNKDLTATGARFPDVSVQLTGADGNAFAIIGRVAAALTRAWHREEADQFVHDAMDCESYDALLQFAMRTVEVR